MFDITQEDEEDSLVGSINSDDAIAKISFFGPNLEFLFCHTTTENLSAWDFGVCRKRRKKEEREREREKEKEKERERERERKREKEKEKEKEKEAEIIVLFVLTHFRV